MDNLEYEDLQESFSKLLTGDKKKDLRFNSKEFDIYKLSVKACKSILSAFYKEKNSKQETLEDLFSNLLTVDKRQCLRLNSKQFEIYESAVMECESIIAELYIRRNNE